MRQDGLVRQAGYDESANTGFKTVPNPGQCKSMLFSFEQNMQKKNVKFLAWHFCYITGPSGVQDPASA